MTLPRDSSANTSARQHQLHRMASLLLYELDNQTNRVNSSLKEAALTSTPFTMSYIVTPQPTLFLNNTTSSAALGSNGIPRHKFSSFFIAQLVFYFVIMVVGASGNFLVLLTIARIKQMRSVKNFFIGNLATADLITLLICLPLNLCGFFVSWPFGEFVCQFIFPLTDVVTGASILTMVAISLDRFRAIVYPFAQKLTLKLTILVMLLIWLLSYLLIGLPLKFSMRLRPGHWVATSCDLVWPSMAYGHVYRVTVLVAFYMFPVTLILLCYLVIGRKLRENLRFASASVRGNKNLERAKKHKRLTTMMFVIFFSFAICMFPINLFFLLIQFHKPMGSWEHTGALYQFSALMFFANSAMNPVILALLSREFRRGFRRNCVCLVCWQSTAKQPGFDTFVRKFVNRPPGGYSDVDTVSRYRTEKNTIGTCVTEIELLPLNENDSPSKAQGRRVRRTNPAMAGFARKTNNNKEIGAEVTET